MLVNTMPLSAKVVAAEVADAMAMLLMLSRRLKHYFARIVQATRG
jgi:hypothetical protein